ncbi:hypothetical protein K432DRAFT_444790 [Lepidopterella palustris CBS 459.81]|uniref:FAD-binding PCMH-type domain-containing protein n=1 Tax=Lepidopterella palustris CBS 459.81 TaxID=1314670 RepID=A0A8E2E6H8_9PEZI|nr:hypothetical protein K432DRAFT_444790 [Lepidopterella palustris CBS 459.81]
MASTSSIRSLSSPTCDVKVLEPGTELHIIISRWSDSVVSLLTAVATPPTEDDIKATIRFASSRGHRIVPDKSSSSVTIAAGALSGDVLAALRRKATLHVVAPNSSTVGIIGAFLDGGSGGFNDVTGFAIDQALTLTATSTGPSATHFNALCAAGHGLSVIISLTLRAFPIASLRSTDSKVWVRKRISPPPAIDIAARLYTSLLPPPAPLVPVLGFMRTFTLFARPGHAYDHAHPLVLRACQGC